jgi:hypothetical protein
MKTRKLGALLMLFSLLASASAPTIQPRGSPVRNSQPPSILRSGSIPSQKEPAEYFTGSVPGDVLLPVIFRLFKNCRNANIKGCSITY